MSDYSVESTCIQLRKLVDVAVERNSASGVLLSGGLDSSVVAAVASRTLKLTGVTVSLKNAPDVKFSNIVAEKFGIDHILLPIDERIAEVATQEAVKIMKSFDPMEIRNDATILIGLRAAKDHGIDEVMTGDAGDELFAGYNFLFGRSHDDLVKSLRNMWKVMRFASASIGKSLGMKVKMPFLEQTLKEFAMSIDPELKIRKEHDQTYGKWILRKAFGDLLPSVIVWRTKMPIERGSGTSILPDYFSSKISDDEFSKKAKEYLQSSGVHIRDKEHLFYYETYEKEFGMPRGFGEGSKICRGCGAYVLEVMDFCRTCGTSPA
jgi:asparagine synthase (glutamine-hydrolysing)